jgi:hypothetical protein
VCELTGKMPSVFNLEMNNAVDDEAYIKRSKSHFLQVGMSSMFVNGNKRDFNMYLNISQIRYEYHEMEYFFNNIATLKINSLAMRSIKIYKCPDDARAEKQGEPTDTLQMFMESYYKSKHKIYMTPSLLRLDLSYNYIGDHGIFWLNDLIATAPKINSLYLGIYI